MYKLEDHFHFLHRLNFCTGLGLHGSDIPGHGHTDVTLPSPDTPQLIQRVPQGDRSI